MKTRDGEIMFTCLDPDGNTSIVIEHEDGHDQGETGDVDTGE